MSCFTFLKVMMILFNLLIFLGGATLLGIGIWVTVDSKSFLNIFGAISVTVLQFVHVGYLLIAIGAVLFLLGFLGCCGAQKESKCLLIMFFTIILIIFIIEIAGAVVALVYTSLAQTILQSTVAKILKDDYGKPNPLTEAWNVTMTNLKCCGLSNYTDFNNSYFYKESKNFYPGQCCNSSISSLSDTFCNTAMAERFNVTGCFEQMLSEIHKNAAVVGGVAAGIGALEIGAMAVAMYLYCKMDEK
ncbi:PREDICTED: tetraspanin-1-like [Thamnophis sirtalis]|uniref:Tetraspanin n=1 Tax=Thamnophis sirtalis TaxID=35019 RepID=A0A6I9XKV1_9SAUR|nr:PREDICTED: tetraspanin-1-like [Thamnophis sirtalis]XP_032074633.1 tetraspanin-1 [Thamnophis elegans]XP_032074636.1 tetraspanin-1-like [Thamnophis elegans]